MDRMLYVAMTGAKQTLVAQAANSHNLSNANTAGFRSDLMQFRSMPLFGPGLASRVFGMAERPGVDLTPGTIQDTGRDLDVAVSSDGFIAVQAPDGSEAYTRAGDLRVDSNGLLETGAGFPVLGNGGPIAIPPAAKIEIGGDGTISVRPLGGSGATLAEIDRIKLVRPDLKNVTKDEYGLLRLREGGELEADASVQLESGRLETSNVNPVDAMVRMIQLSRQFEMQVQMMKTAGENESMAAQMMRLG